MIFVDDDNPGRKLALQVIRDIFPLVTRGLTVFNPVQDLEMEHSRIGKEYMPGSGGGISDILRLWENRGWEDRRRRCELQSNISYPCGVKIESTDDSWLREKLPWLFVDESNSADGGNLFTADMAAAANKPGTGPRRRQISTPIHGRTVREVCSQPCIVGVVNLFTPSGPIVRVILYLSNTFPASSRSR